jgi:hypothetical protein
MGKNHDTSNPPYIALEDAIYANKLARVNELHDA